MSLKVSRRPDTNTLWITGTVRPAGAPQGVRVRQRAGSDSAALAREEAASIESRILREAWHGRRAASRSFFEAVESYLTHEPRTAATKAFIARLVEHFGDVPLAHLDQDAADKARAALFRPDASPSTVRRGLFTPLAAVLNHASHPARRWCETPRFDMPSEPRGRTEFMLPDQAEAVVNAASPRVRPLLHFLLCTGCRMSEALGLQWHDVDLAAGRAILWEGETKGGGRRVVQIPLASVAALTALPARTGHVFLTHRGQPYRDSDNGGGQVKKAWATACRRAGVTGFTPHHLRHSWASWHYAVHRDLLRLKADGGWGQTRMVERYAHIMPIGHEDAINRVWHVADTAAG